MLDLQQTRNTFDITAPVSEQAESDTVETFELMDRPAVSWLAKVPVAGAFALLGGTFLTGLGVAGFLPIITANDVLLGFFQVDPVSNVLHLLTGLAGIAAGMYALRSRRESAAIAYAAAMMLVYLVYFSAGNIAYGNGEGLINNQHALFLNLLPTRDLPAFMANGMHISYALVSLLVVAASALQAGARTTAQRGTQLIREYRSRTMIRQTV